MTSVGCLKGAYTLTLEGESRGGFPGATMWVCCQQAHQCVVCRKRAWSVRWVNADAEMVLVLETELPNIWDSSVLIVPVHARATRAICCKARSRRPSKASSTGKT